MVGAWFSLIFNSILIKNLPFWSSSWSGVDSHWFSIQFLLKTYHFWALAGRGSIFIDFQWNSYEKPTILEPWLVGARFHWFSIKFSLKTYHFRTLAGRGLIFIELPFWSPRWSVFDFHWCSIKFLLKTYHFVALAFLDMFWGCLGTSWACFGHVLDYLGLVMSWLEPILHHLRDVLGLSWAILCLNP